ncbi:hypothetical protein C8Q77DRAFT_1059353, partial [Trametes polyzona]
MKYLYLPVERGGLNLIDLESRNEAIELTWLRAYLDFGPNRPLWAEVADALYAHHIPKNCGVRDVRMRINPFLQHWKPKVTSLPDMLKGMMTVAAKYGLRVDGLAFGREILRQMPIWDHAQTDMKAVRKLATASAVVTCLCKNHNVRTVGDCEQLEMRMMNVNHTPTRTCTCAGCEYMIVMEGCANPHRCYARAKQLLDTLPPKWDPRGEHPEDYEDAQQRTGLTAGIRDADSIFDRRVTTRGSMGEIFRIFTEGRPTPNTRLDMRMVSEDPIELIAATDGSCKRNGDRNAQAGAGVFIAEGHQLNQSVRLPAALDQSNQTGEMVATYLATTQID